jgi:hypothetical protein
MVGLPGIKFSVNPSSKSAVVSCRQTNMTKLIEVYFSYLRCECAKKSHNIYFKISPFVFVLLLPQTTLCRIRVTSEALLLRHKSHRERSDVISFDRCNYLKSCRVYYLHVI